MHRLKYLSRYIEPSSSLSFRPIQFNSIILHEQEQEHMRKRRTCTQFFCRCLLHPRPSLPPSLLPPSASAASHRHCTLRRARASPPDQIWWWGDAAASSPPATACRCRRRLPSRHRLPLLLAGSGGGRRRLRRLPSRADLAEGRRHHRLHCRAATDMSVRERESVGGMDG